MNWANFRFGERLILCFSGANLGWGQLEKMKLFMYSHFYRSA